MADINYETSNEIKLTKGEVTIPATGVSVYSAIYQRRMAWKFSDQPVPHEALQRMLDSAVWAPNHRLTEPWRFFVLEKESAVRGQVADLAYEFAMQRNNDSARAERSKQAVLAPPVLVYVFCVPGNNDEVTRENYAAVCCAVQNICLAGVAEGVAVAWETGGPTRHPDLKTVLGAEEDWVLAAMLSIGIPGETINSRRTPVSKFVRFLT